jgi:hypothetical protein
MKLQFLEAHFSFDSIEVFLEHHANAYCKTQKRPTGRYFTLATILSSLYFSFTPINTSVALSPTVAISLRDVRDPPDEEIMVYYFDIVKARDLWCFLVERNLAIP